MRSEELFDRPKRFLGKKSIKQIHSLKVAVAGNGVVGHLLSAELARIGVQELRLLDCDRVKKVNLANSFLFTTYHVGKSKVDATRSVVYDLALRPINVLTCEFDVTDPDNYDRLLDVIKGADLVFGSYDNVPARLSTNSAVIKTDTKYVDIGIEGFAGRIRFIDRTRACYACNPLATQGQLANIYRISKDADCDYAPTITILPITFNIVSHAILEGLKFLGVLGTSPDYDYIYFDFLTPSNPVKMKLTKRDDCIICGKDGLVSWV